MAKIRTTADGQITWEKGTRLYAYSPAKRRVAADERWVVVDKVGRKWATVVGADGDIPWYLRDTRFNMETGQSESGYPFLWRLYASEDHLREVQERDRKVAALVEWKRQYTTGQFSSNPFFADALYALLVEHKEIEAD